MRADLPSGTVTFLFTDVEGSTRLLHTLGAEGYAEALAEHRRLIRGACASVGGVEVDTQGDAFFFAFPTAPSAIAAASAFTEALAPGPISVRVGLHTGTPLLTSDGYVGEDVHRAARIAAAGHGGQVLVSVSTAVLIGPSDKVSERHSLTDLGEHRLKDLSAPERIYQLGEGEFPPLKSLYRTNLPVPATAFLGREAELAEVRALLARDDVRLLTLTGPGGTGKTRLALQAVAQASDDYPDGVFWVPLAPLRDPALVLEEASQAVGAKDGLAQHLADKHLLLLLDNFEHLLEAAPGLAGPLASCPNLRLVVTSREPLHVSGEQEYPVPPLAEEDGVGLFLARARAVKPAFEADDVVAEICRRLDELPLALELAAARVKALSAAQILERLEQRLPLLTGGARDLPERQRTLRATIEWSHDLLTEEEQRLFARLAVFRGGCTLEAAEAVTDADLDSLQSLVDKSLLRHNEERYWMLETIREYAGERLEASGEGEELRRRHALLYEALAAQGEPHLMEEGPWLERVAAEQANLRAALLWFALREKHDAMARMVLSLGPFWWRRSQFEEAERWLEQALATVPSSDAAIRARLLERGATTASWRGAYDREEAYADESIALSRELGDWELMGWALLDKGYARAERGDFEQSAACLEEAARIAREHDSPRLASSAAFNLGGVMLRQNRLLEGRRLSSEAYDLARIVGAPDDIVFALVNLGYASLLDGRVEDAAARYREGLEICGRRANVALGSTLLAGAACVLAQRGQPAAASTILGAARELFVVTGAGEWWIFDGMQELAEKEIGAGLDTLERDRLAEEGRRLSFDDAVDLALVSLD